MKWELDWAREGCSIAVGEQRSSACCVHFVQATSHTRATPPRNRCGHCKQLQSTWEQLAGALKGVVNVAAVDADAHGALAQQYGIK